jgi:hypothetical protein
MKLAWGVGVGIAALAFAACQPQALPTPIEVQLSKDAPADTVTLALEGGVRLAPAGTLVTFAAVVADSRCPADVTCVWAGSVRARFVASENAGTATSFELESNGEPRSVFVDGRELRIVAVHPDRRDDRPVQIDLEIRLVARN